MRFERASSRMRSASAMPSATTSSSLPELLSRCRRGVAAWYRILRLVNSLCGSLATLPPSATP